MVDANGSTLLIKRGRLIDPANDRDQQCDLLVVDGRIAQVGINPDPADRVIDASGLIVSPGLIDMHVHLREPGNEEEETIASGTAAAVAGGFTSLACMPNTSPPLDNEANIEFVLREASQRAACNVFPIGAITKGRKGEELTEMGTMVRAGTVAFSDDGDGVADAGVMYRALQYVTMFDKTIIQHCQEQSLAANGYINAGYTSTVLGLPGIPAMAEQLMVYRDLVLAEATMARYHVAHVSTAAAVELIRQAKQRRIRVTAEVAPHHLLLTDEALRNFDTNCKVSPPLRTPDDIAALKQGLADGTIDCLASDHAPHSAEEKELELPYAPFGIISLEAALSLYVKTLIEPDVLTWPGVIAAMTINPAKALQIDKGTLSVGADADITLIDPDASWRIDVAAFRSKSRNCPYDGWQRSKVGWLTRCSHPSAEAVACSGIC